MVNIDEISQEYIENSHKLIGANVKRIRESKNISQLELSHRIGHKSVSIVSCAEISHKKHHFNIEHLLRIAFVLEVDICEFFKEIKISLPMSKLS
ncbi:MAG: helix-turn-helix transcriptional regulator [Campylobacterota bacterium]|nr:helix-turn-helix transcriptional regulator [Campylobacterota bacterium]